MSYGQFERANAWPDVNPLLFSAMQRAPSFSHTPWADLDIHPTLDYFRKRYIIPLSEQINIREATLVDCAAGFGWLGLAFLLCGGKRAIFADIDAERLRVAREFSSILGLDSKADFLDTPMQDLDFGRDGVDVFASIETIEHVGERQISRCIDVIRTSARQAVILTTPNKLFPVIMHDTRLPFAHMLPLGARASYVRLLGKRDEDTNEFVAPWRLLPLYNKFRPVSRCQCFRSCVAWAASFPYYMPYREASVRWKAAPPTLQGMYYRLASAVLGRNAFWISQNLATLWARKDL